MEIVRWHKKFTCYSANSVWSDWKVCIAQPRSRVRYFGRNARLDAHILEMFRRNAHFRNQRRLSALLKSYCTIFRAQARTWNLRKARAPRLKKRERKKMRTGKREKQARMRNLRETEFEMRVARQRCKQWKTASYVPNLTSDSTNLANRSLRLRNLI